MLWRPGIGSPVEDSTGRSAQNAVSSVELPPARGCQREGTSERVVARVRHVCMPGRPYRPRTMKTVHHAALSGIASLAVVVVLAPGTPLAHLAVGTVVGVAIDVDHFPISRARGGDWRAARRVLANPAVIVTDPERIFVGAPVGPVERLLSHVLLGTGLSATAWLARPTFGVVVAVSLYVHVLADLCWDVWRRHRDPAARPAQS